MKPTHGAFVSLITALAIYPNAGQAIAFSEETLDSLSVTLEDVNVTALKQGQSLRRRPEAASLLSQNALERANVTAMKGMSDIIPNFFIPDYGSRITSTIYVRGIGARMDQPSVGLNVDNVPYLNKDSYDFDVDGIASVEMLRGPQSTLYGRNTMAGVMNITTISPMRFQGWRIAAEGSSRGRARLSLGWFGKPRDGFGVGVTVSGSETPGEFKNQYNGKNLDWERNFSIRNKIQWHSGNGLNLMNAMSAGYLRQGGYPYEWKETRQVAFNDTCFYRRFTFADGLTLSKSFDLFTLTSISAFQYIDDNMTLDQDFTPKDYFTLTQKKREPALSEDLVFKSKDSEHYRWLSGLFGFWKNLSMEAPVVFRNAGVSELIETHRNNANPHYPIRWNTREFPLNSEFNIPTFGVAVYHQSQFSSGDFDFEAALRSDYERAELHFKNWCNTGYMVYDCTTSEPKEYKERNIDINDQGKVKRQYVRVIPKLAVTYNFPSGIGNVYAKWTRGYKAGGFNTQMFSDVLQQRLMGFLGIGSKYDVDEVVGYKPEDSWNYEVGTHLEFSGIPLMVDAAAFFIDCRNQQLTVFPDGNVTGRIMTNAGKTKSMGFELSASWRPDCRNAVNASYGFTDARFADYFNGVQDFKGKRIPYAPENTLFLQWIWKKRISEYVSMETDVNFKGTGKIYWNEINSESQKFYGLLGCGLTLRIKNADLQLWGRNLTAAKYKTFYFLSMGREFYQRGKGTELGLTARITI